METLNSFILWKCKSILYYFDNCLKITGVNLPLKQHYTAIYIYH